ncbi:hypothetical protein RIF29_04215 [Crotalaria pallida]|uniref:Uncharacterized protein n=1 Tax=Crotalaria pallida TaxID=3830 RepID=A0AAN9J101_CROPI
MASLRRRRRRSLPQTLFRQFPRLGFVIRDLFDMGDRSDLEAQAAYQSEPLEQMTNLDAPNLDEVYLVREDLPATITEKPPSAPSVTQENEDPDFDDTLYWTCYVFAHMLCICNILCTGHDIAKKNAINKAKQKYLHRTGPVNFARIRSKLLEKKENSEGVYQAEMFIETRTSRKGKKVDEETEFVIGKLRDSVQESRESAEKTFRSLLGKERSDRVRCYGRTVTPSQFKKNEEIAALKKQYAEEKKEHENEMNKMKMLVRSLLKQNNSNLDDEALDIMVENAIANENSVSLYSSTSTNIPNIDKVGLEGYVQDIDDEE